MDSFGRYVLQYQPGNDDTEYLQVGIQMNISAEATLSDMTAFFDSFLKAAGYYYDGELQIVNDEPETPKVDKPWEATQSNQDFWDDDGFSFTGNPNLFTIRSPRESDQIIVGSGLRGGMTEDIIKFS